MNAPHAQPDHESEIQQFFTRIGDVSKRGISGVTCEPNHIFVPYPELRTFFQNEQAVTRLLHSVFGFDRALPVVAHEISGRYERVFSILLCIGRGPYIRHFIQKDLSDDRLPLEAPPEGFPISTTDANFFNDFYKSQWRFYAHTFKRNYNRRDIKNEVILPIIHTEKLGSGVSADIFKIVIHPAYNDLQPKKTGSQNSDDPFGHTFVLKRYYTVEAQRYFDSELEAFRKLSPGGSTEPNLIGFYGSFEQHGTYNILLQYADQGTLEDYFQKKAPPVHAEDIQSFWRNLFDLIKALEKIHRVPPGDARGPRVLQGWHQDVKPANILVVSNGSTSRFNFQFKLADLGLSHFTTTIGSNVDSQAGAIRGTRTYGAPEPYTDAIEGSEQEVQPHADIWSLGCVYSEAVTWVVRGWEGIEEYRRLRAAETDQIHDFRDGDCFHNGELRLQVIDDWHKQLVQLKRPTDHITEPVWNTMLKDMLGEAEERPLAKALLVKARRILSATDRMIQSSSARTGEPQRSRTTDTDVPSQYQRPQTPPESPYGSNSRGTMLDQRNVPFPAYRERSPRLTLSRPHEMSPGGMSEGERIAMTRSSHSYSRSASSFGITSSTAPTSPTSPLHQPGNRRTQDSLAPYDILPGVPHPAMNSLGSALELGREPSTTSRMTNTSEGSQIPSHLTPSEHNSSPRASSSFLGPSSPTTRDLGNHAPDRDSGNGLQYRLSGNSFALPGNSPAGLVPLQNTPSPPVIHLAQTASRPNPRKAPFLSVPRLHQWRHQFRENRSSLIIDNAERYHLLPADKRDHVFVVDDASSMQAHWTDVTYLFADFAYLIKGLDPDGLELCFTVSLEKKRSKNTKDLLTLVKKRGIALASAGPSTSNPESRLAALLGEFVSRLENEKAPHTPFMKKPSPVRPMNLYVLTDGVWQPRCEVENAIRDFVVRLEKLNLPRQMVGIQFIQFGSDEAATRRLAHLDGGIGLERNIVDTEPFKDGNVWKMLNGSIDSRYKEPQFLVTTSTVNAAELPGDSPAPPYGAFHQ